MQLVSLDDLKKLQVTPLKESSKDEQIAPVMLDVGFSKNVADKFYRM